MEQVGETRNVEQQLSIDRTAIGKGSVYRSGPCCHTNRRLKKAARVIDKKL